MDASYRGAHLCLRIRRFGDLRVKRDGVPIDGLARPRCQALLAYLLLHREAAQSRRHLAFLLWPDSSEAQALTNSAEWGSR
jgi:DNA-binding SARP family transcriptional activator